MKIPRNPKEIYNGGCGRREQMRGRLGLRDIPYLNYIIHFKYIFDYVLFMNKFNHHLVLLL